MRIRTPTLLLVASLVANAVLVAAVIVKAPYVFQASSYFPSGGAVDPQSGNLSVGPATKSATSSDLLSNMDKMDLKTLAARLKAQGVSRALMRAILWERTNGPFLARRKALAAQVVPEPYWSKKFGLIDPKIWEGIGAVNKEQKDLIDSLMGPYGGSEEDPMMTVMVANRRGNIPEADMKRVQSIQADYQQMRADLMGKMSGPPLPEDTAKLAYLSKEEKEDMSAAMTPEEYQEYQLRNSNVSASLRDKLQAFNPSEDEFTALFKVQSAFNDQYGSPFDMMTGDQQKARQEHQADLLTSIEGVLSPDRFADYKAETDPDYISANNLVEKLGLPSTTTPQIVSVQADMEKRSDAIAGDNTLSLADRLSDLSALNDEATTKLTAVLGDAGLKAYRQNGGWWLQRLQPPKK